MIINTLHLSILEGFESGKGVSELLNNEDLAKEIQYLEEEGYIEAKFKPSGNEPPYSEYQITNSGRIVLQEK